MKKDKKVYIRDERKGYATLLVLGFLAVMAIYGITYMTACCYFLKTSKNYMVSVKAKYLAEAGANHAIAKLKNDARNNFAYNDNVSIGGPQFLGEGIYTVDIKDEQSKININNASLSLLTNLFRVNVISDPTTKASDIVAYRIAHPFITIEEIIAVDGIGKGTFNKIKDLITVTSYKDPNCDSRSPININTADDKILEAVLVSLSDGIIIIWFWDARKVVNTIKAEITNNGSFNHPDGWSRFRDAVESAGIPTDWVNIIIANCNPNSNKAGLAQPTTTTEFCFHSGGYYSLQSTGIVKKGGVEVSEKKINTIVKVYDIWNQTTKEDFIGEDVNGNGSLDTGEDVDGDGTLDTPTVNKVNWKNSCPINYDCLKTHIYDPDEAVTIDNALKIGFWDNFTESNFRNDYDTDGTDRGDWISLQESFSINEDGDGMLRTRWPTELPVDGLDYFPAVELDKSKWRFDDFSIRVRMMDETSGSKTWKRTDLPWPAVPIGWETAGDGGNPAFERYFNVGHLQFGDVWDHAHNPCQLSAMYLGYPQMYDVIPNTETPEYDARYGVGNYDVDGADNALYNAWVSFALMRFGGPRWEIPSAIWWAPDPAIKDYSVVSQPNLYVVYNDWEWWGHPGGIGGTKTFSVPGYKSDKTFQFRSKGMRDLEGVVYYGGGSTSFDAGNEPLFTYKNRYIKLVGMGNLPDADNIRIISRHRGLGSDPCKYISIDYDTGETIEQGTVSGTVTKLDTANAGTTVNLAFASPGSSTSVEYRADFYSMDDDIEDTPVLEDVFVTYLKPTKILYYSEVKN